MSSRKEFIVPVFIPHLGCPHLCVFCNQRNISGASHAPSPEEVLNYLDASLSPEKPEAVIAFYGGTFTAIPLSEQEKYLSIARRFIAQKRASGIRLSTRPDGMDERVALFLKEHSVRTVELGVQSLDDGVLKKSGRGHTADDAAQAARMVKDAGLELGIQLMAGLPGDSKEKFLETVSGTARLKPHFVRIYPALVVDGSQLADLWRRGEYSPLSLDEAVELCAEALEIFEAAGIRVIRLGLQPGEELEKTLLAGPYHPSFGHLVKSRIALKKMLDALEDFEGDSAEIFVNPKELSIYKGIGSSNIKAVFSDTGKSIKISAGNAVPGTFKILP
jgi:histone acetyltransferase (RNA polymerase elongator complex component)